MYRRSPKEEASFWKGALVTALVTTIVVQAVGFTRAAHIMGIAGAWGAHTISLLVAAFWPGLIVFGGACAIYLATEPRDRPRGGRSGAKLAMAVVPVGTLILLCIILLPSWLVGRDAGSNSPPADRARAVNDVRSTLLQGIGGLLIAAGVVATWRQLAITREGQITERLTRAVDQLGSDAVDVRLGGIYALERLTKDSIGDRSVIFEILSAYVQVHSPWPPRLQGQLGVEVPLEHVPQLQERAPDVQAAMTVLGRRFAGLKPSWRDGLRLNGVDLRKANLTYAELVYSDLKSACLDGANMKLADLERADLSHASLKGADLSYAKLEGALLHASRLDGANLYSANIINADLSESSLREAYLVRTELNGAKFDRADLLRTRYEEQAEQKNASFRQALSELSRFLEDSS